MVFFNFQKFFNWSRLIDPVPTESWQFLNLGLGIGIGLIVLAIIRMFWPGFKELKSRTVSILLTIGFTSLLLVFFRWQTIPYFSARILWLALLIIAIIWSGFILYFRQVIVPKKILQEKIVKRRNRYHK